jgi:hypothetical protein
MNPNETPSRLFHAVVILGMALTQSACGGGTPSGQDGSNASDSAQNDTALANDTMVANDSATTDDTMTVADTGVVPMTDASGDAFAGWFCCG